MYNEDGHSTLDTVIRRFALLCLALCVVLFAAPGWAADVYVANEQELGAAVQTPGNVVHFKDNITLDSSLVLNKNCVTLDGNGHTLKLGEKKTGSVIVVECLQGTVNINNLIITGGKGVLLGGGVRVDDGTVNLTHCNITDNSATEAGGGGGGVLLPGRGGKQG